MLHEGVKKLLDSTAGRSTEYLCHWAGVRTGEKNPFASYGQVCYYSMKNPSGFEHLAVSMTHHVMNKNEEEKKMYLNWVINHSPLKDAYLNKKYYIRYGMHLNTDLEFSFLVTAAIALRITWEFPQSVSLWCKLVKDGVDPVVAHVIIHNAHMDDKGKLSHYNILSNHGMFRHASKDIIKNYRNLNGKKGTPTKEYAGSYRIFDLTDGKSPAFTPEGLGFKVKGEGWRQEKVCKYEDLVKRLKEMQ